VCQTRAGVSGSWFGIAPNEAKALATALAIRPPIGMIAPLAIRSRDLPRCSGSCDSPPEGTGFEPSAENATAVERGPAADHLVSRDHLCLMTPSSLSVRNLSSATAERPFTRASGNHQFLSGGPEQRPAHGTIDNIADWLLGGDRDGAPLGCRPPRKRHRPQRCPPRLLSPHGKRALVVRSGANRVGLFNIDVQKVSYASPPACPWCRARPPGSCPR